MNETTREAMFSSATDEWATPDEFVDALPFRFDLDVCANQWNAKAMRYFTKEQDGLAQTWTGVCWMNPPYGRGIGKWVAKAADSAKYNDATVVCLLPARTDTAWWHDDIWDIDEDGPRPHVQVAFVRGRLKFGGSKNSAPFPSVLVVFWPWGTP